MKIFRNNEGELTTDCTYQHGLAIDCQDCCNGRMEAAYQQFKANEGAEKAHKPNDPKQAGTRAAEKEYFGVFRRFAVYPVHTRFDDVKWFVADSETPDELGHASIIRQEDSRAAAIQGLD